VYNGLKKVWDLQVYSSDTNHLISEQFSERGGLLDELEAEMTDADAE
jgi:hypothetical protein